MSKQNYHKDKQVVNASHNVNWNQPDTNYLFSLIHKN